MNRNIQEEITYYDPSLIQDLIDLQRLAAMKDMRINVVTTVRVKRTVPEVSRPVQVIGIECLPSESFFKTNL